MSQFEAMKVILVFDAGGVVSASRTSRTGPRLKLHGSPNPLCQSVRTPPLANLWDCDSGVGPKDSGSGGLATGYGGAQGFGTN
eukprot:scaffold152139_cov39-Prasinocladus_malaysianus.AAC.1